VTLRVVSKPEAMRALCQAARRVAGPDARLGLVPTMGALHEGHLSLVRAAKARCDLVAVSLFVNPTQFAPHEDLAKYPRTFEADCALLQEAEVDLLFAPTPEDMYPQGTTQTWVDVPEIGSRLDGRSRPGHFRGVTTVVSKLFHVVGPDMAFFGQKDAAQVAVLRAMVSDLDFPVELLVCPTVREPDGLAMSSRNRYLSADERARALVLSRALRRVQALAAGGTYDVSKLQEALQSELSSTPAVRVDYAEIVDPDTLLPVADMRRGALIAVAAWLGATRLIDNVLLPPLQLERAQ
jgi:pantoate--beta-alanine ligase